MRNYCLFILLVSSLCYSCAEWPGSDKFETFQIEWKASSVINMYDAKIDLCLYSFNKELVDTDFTFVYKSLYEGDTWKKVPMVSIDVEGNNTVTLLQLSPRTTYQYYVSSKTGMFSDINKFQTPEYNNPSVKCDLKVSKQEQKIYLIGTIEDSGGCYGYSSYGFLLKKSGDSDFKMLLIENLGCEGNAYNEFSKDITEYFSFSDRDMTFECASFLYTRKNSSIGGLRNAESDTLSFTFPFDWKRK